MGGLFEPIRMRFITEEASPPEKMNFMHTDLQIEVEKQLLVDDWKNARLACPGQYFQVQKNDRFASPEWSPIICP